MDETVIPTIRADHEVFWPIVEFVLVDMVNNRTLRQRMAECPLGHENVF
jgi:hypothetical protein